MTKTTYQYALLDVPTGAPGNMCITRHLYSDQGSSWFFSKTLTRKNLFYFLAFFIKNAERNQINPPVEHARAVVFHVLAELTTHVWHPWVVVDHCGVSIPQISKIETFSIKWQLLTNIMSGSERPMKPLFTAGTLCCIPAIVDAKAKTSFIRDSEWWRIHSSVYIIYVMSSADTYLSSWYVWRTCGRTKGFCICTFLSMSHRRCLSDSVCTNRTP